MSRLERDGTRWSRANAGIIRSITVDNPFPRGKSATPWPVGPQRPTAGAFPCCRVLPLPKPHRSSVFRFLAATEGPTTILGLTQTKDGTLKLLAAAGESVHGERLQIGNTNSRLRFQLEPTSFFKRSGLMSQPLGAMGGIPCCAAVFKVLHLTRS